MKKKVAFICALPPRLNTGMVTVDLSALNVLAKLEHKVEVNFYGLGAITQRLIDSADDVPFHYKTLQDSLTDVIGHDLIIFWGDFLQAKTYWDGDLIPRLVREGVAADRDRAIKLAYSCLLLEGCDDAVLAKVILFGGTLISDSVRQTNDPRYRAGLERLIGKANAVFFRDALSAAKVAPLRDTPTLGMDCAFLLDDTHLEQLRNFSPCDPEDRDGVGVFFGRTPALRNMLRLARSTATGLKSPMRWIPWFATLSPRRRIMLRLAGLQVPAAPLPPGDILSDVARCRFIITDTYHLCVNAWRLGVPAVCIGEGSNNKFTSLGDKKKEILFQTYGASEFYIFSEQITNRKTRSGVARRVEALLTDEAMVQGVSNAIAVHRNMARGRLMTAIHAVLR